MSAARAEVFLWAVQRVTAAFLAFFVLVHLVTMVYAVRGGLTAAEIIARTHSSLAWPLFYTLFVFAASMHGAIGLRVVAAEWLGWRGWSANVVVAAIGIGLVGLGLRAVLAVAA